MGLSSILKDILIYKEPAAYEQFELLEDETEDKSFKEEKSIKESKRFKRFKESEAPKKSKKQADSKARATQGKETPVDKKLQVNLERIKAIFNFPTNQDVIIREFKVMQQSNAFIVYIDGMADNATINNYILRQLMEERDHSKGIKINTVDFIVNNLLSSNEISEESEYILIIKQILNGLTALFIEGSDKCILIESRGHEKRNISPPLTEKVVRGPQEAFIEDLRTNITLVRKIVRNKDLVTEMLPVGKVNNISCALLYIRGITNMKIVEEVKRRITSIDIDLISSDGMLDQIIEDHPFALFPQILSTERPDRTASFLVEGKAALICDGAPFVSIVPVTIYHMLHSSEDYSLRWQYATFARFIRVLAAFFTVFLPAIYISLILFHHEMIPTELLVSLEKARENLPFPTILEVVLNEAAWELIREAGIRVPGVIGQTLGIIGAVILGQAAVAAGLVSPILIIIVAITGLGSFAIPDFSLSFGFRIIRFAFTFLGAIAGFYGIAAGIFIFGGLACSMKSFGVPFLAPTAPKTKTNSDLIIKMPAWLQKRRPDFLNPQDRTRTGRTIRGWAAHDSKRDGND